MPGLLGEELGHCGAYSRRQGGRKDLVTNELLYPFFAVEDCISLRLGLSFFCSFLQAFMTTLLFAFSIRILSSFGPVSEESWISHQVAV